MTTTQERTIIGARQFAREAGVDVATVCRWARAGTVPTVGKLAGERGAWLFAVDQIEPYIKRSPAGAAGTPRPGSPS